MSEVLEKWRGKFLRVLQSGHWEYADRIGATGAVAIVAVTPAQKLVLIEQYRIPVGKRVVELPAGLLGDVEGQATEELLEAAQRELLEETGYEAARINLLTSGPPSAGLASELVAFVFADGLKRTGTGGGGEHEQIQVHEVNLDVIADWLISRTTEGVLIDPKIYAGLYFLRQ
jgi:ADP-ribose pyrophosphatase